MESGVTPDFFNKFKKLCKQKEVEKTYWFTRSIVERRW